MRKEILSYAGVNIPAKLYTERKTWELMPSRSIETKRFGKQNGEHFLYAHDEMREFTVEFAMIAPTRKEVWDLMATVQSWLRHKKPQPMIFSDRPNIYYNTILVDGSEVDKFSRLGKMTLRFVCPDPYGYEVSMSESEFDEDGIAIIEGLANVPTEPRIELEPVAPITNLLLATHDDDFMMFGKPAENGNVYDPKRVVFNDAGTRIENWTVGNGLADGHIDGAMKSNGNRYSVQDFGSPSENSLWYGPAVMRSLENNLEIQDFRCEVKFNLFAEKVKEQGRVEVYMLDKNGVRVARMSLRVGNPAAITPYLEVDLGSQEVFRGYGDRPTTWRSAKDALFTIERRGEFWSFSIGIWNTRLNRYDARKTIRYRNESNPYLHKIGGVQIAMARKKDAEGEGGERPPIQDMNIDNIKIIEFNRPADEPGDPVIIQAGDVLNIDSNEHTIMLNGLPFYQHLDPSSKFIEIEAGFNAIKVEPAVPGKIYYRKRVL